MKNIKDYIKIEKQEGKDGEKSSTTFHKITLEKEKELGENKAQEIKNYFAGMKSKYEGKEKGKYRILIPKDAYDLKILIDDLNTILNS